MKATKEAEATSDTRKSNELKFTQTKWSISAAASTYEGSPIDLLLATLRLLRACERIDESATLVRHDFEDALLKFIKADVAELGEAFRLRRPKNWNQNAEQFFMREMPDIEDKIIDLKDKIKNGKKLGIEGACRIVGAEYSKSWGKIRNDYYKYKKRLRPFRENKLRELEEEYYESLEYQKQDPKISYEERLETNKIAEYEFQKYAKYL